MKRLGIILVALMFLLSMFGGLAQSNVAVNPSSQMHNQGAIATYIEGSAMKDLGYRFSNELKKRGIGSKVFWSGYGDRIAGLIVEVRQANAYGAEHFISLHSDSAGVDNTNKLLILYTSSAGKKLAEAIGDYTSAQLDFRLEYRQKDNLYVLNQTIAPAILIEVLNHSNVSDCTRLLDHNFRQKLAESLADGYAKYVGKSISVLPIPRPIPKVRTPKSAKVNYDSVLRYGSVGVEVTTVQSLLQALGYDVTVDSYFGSQTRTAVLAFQRDNHLVSDGVVGSVTWRYLRSPVTIPITISKGDTGRLVTMLQDRIAKIYPGWHLAVDGDFGSHTDTAVRIYQRFNNLVEDGIVGRQTWTSLLK